jgi:hypothetical protein
MSATEVTFSLTASDISKWLTQICCIYTEALLHILIVEYSSIFYLHAECLHKHRKLIFVMATGSVDTVNVGRVLINLLHFTAQGMKLFHRRVIIPLNSNVFISFLRIFWVVFADFADCHSTGSTMSSASYREKFTLSLMLKTDYTLNANIYYAMRVLGVVWNGLIILFFSKI